MENVYLILLKEGRKVKRKKGKNTEFVLGKTEFDVSMKHSTSNFHLAMECVSQVFCLN